MGAAGKAAPGPHPGRPPPLLPRRSPGRARREDAQHPEARRAAAAGPAGGDAVMTFPHGALLLRYEVAALFKVEPKTISRWTAAGKLHPVTMPGGRYRFLAGEVRALLLGQTLTP